MEKPDWVENSYPSYDDLINSMGYEVVSADVCGSYQGDYLVLLADGVRRGLLVFGYGSCSGCDTLEAVAPWGEDEDWKGVVELRDDLKREIHWEPDSTSLAAYLTSQRSEMLKWYWHDAEIRGVLTRYEEVLRAC